MNKRPRAAPPSQPRVLEVPIENTDEVVCDKCQGTAWLAGLHIYRVSRLVSGTPTDVFARVPVFVCAGCGAMIEEKLTTLRIQL